MNKYCVLVAGGTGGHINAAIGLGEKLSEDQYKILYLTGQRPLDYQLFKNKNVLHLASQALRSKNPRILFEAVIKNFLTFFRILSMFAKERPQFIIGAGGYVCGPTLMAGWILRIPIFIIEQNAVMGVTNKILSYFSNKIFLHFKDTQGLKENLKKKSIVVGNPIRKSIKFSPPREKREGLNVLVFGGSLGATQVNMMIMELIQKDCSFPISIVHQTGIDKTPQVMLGKNVTYSSHKYLDNIAEYYSWCDVIISRAGASTIAELRVVKKPCYLVPYPQATDNHQYFNAKALKDEKLFFVEYNNSRENDAIILKNIEKFIQDQNSLPLLSSHNEHCVLDSSVETIKAVNSYVGLT